MSDTLHTQLQDVKDRHSIIVNTIKKLTVDRNNLQDEIDKLEKQIENNLTVEDLALKMLQGHPKEKLQSIWKEYLEVRHGLPIAGLIEVTDLEGARNCDKLFYTMLKEVGGDLLVKAFGNLLEYTLDDNGEKLYPFDQTKKRVFKVTKDKFNRKVRKSSIVDAFRPYANIVKIISKHGLA